MSFVVRAVTQNYYFQSVTKDFYNFSGRTSRKEYGQYCLFYLIGLLSMVAMDRYLPIGSPQQFGFITFMYLMLLFIPSFNITVRRLNDYYENVGGNLSTWDFVILAITKKYSNFTGRAQRKEFWMFNLFYFLASMLMMAIDILVFNSELEIVSTPLSITFSLVMLIPYFSVTVRRLHDIGKSGLFLILGLIPLIGVGVLLYFFCKDSVHTDNKFGSSPKYATDTPTVFA